MKGDDMATAEQIKSLIRSHFDNDRERFLTISLQLAAHEAKQGHSSVAHEIRDLVNKNRKTIQSIPGFGGELDDLIFSTFPKTRLTELIVSKDISSRINRILREHHQQEKLQKHGLSNRRKLLLAGPPGTGKTMTATILASELSLPLYTILMDKMITRFMGETSAKMRQVFELIQQVKGVYLFDEFDAIGAERGRENDVGEMRRVLNAFLQFIEQDRSGSIIIAATNNAHILDQALFRRFDDILYYGLPSSSEIEQLIRNRLGEFLTKKQSLADTVKTATKLSPAEIAQACDDAIKETILADKPKVTVTLLKKMLKERKNAYQRGNRT
jgi:SpoVK/Ycf46/Vps4 family AAA+-type ATPase